MLLVSASQCMTRLRIILQSNGLYLILLIFLIIYVFVFTKLINYYSVIPNDTTFFEGMITHLNTSKEHQSFILKTNKEKIMVYYYSDDSLLEEGMIVQCEGIIKEPSNNTIPNTFNYKEYLYNKKIYKIFNASNIKTVKPSKGFYKIKNLIINKINNKQRSEYYKLFILGSKNELDENIYKTYKENGIAHLLAISGMHVSLLILIIKKILIKIKESWTDIILIVIISFYLFLTNFTVSIMRCYVYLVISIINNRLKLNISPIKMLGITALILIIYNPFYIYDVGFQYSMVITAGLILSTKYIQGNYFKRIIVISIFALLFSFPITINNNYEISLLSVLNNIVMVPYVSFILYPFTIISLFIPWLTPIYNYLIIIFELFNRISNVYTLKIIVPRLNMIVIFIYYIFIFLFIRLSKKKYIFLAIVVIMINKKIYDIYPYYQINYLDVGQGDSTLIKSPYNNNTILIDTGGNLNGNTKMIFNTILYLKSINISKINTLILTHGDYDHMGEAINLVNNFKVEKVIFNCGEFNDLEKELIKVLDKKKIKYYSCIKELNIDNNKLYFLQTKEYDNENDNSNVIYTELNGYKFMFMGDAGVDKEKDILDKYNISDVDVLKVGHHGSKTSSGKDFIDEINPKYSIISVGKKNRYGHPNKEVINNLEQSKIYRTDEDGSIIFKVKNNKLKIETCSP